MGRRGDQTSGLHPPFIIVLLGVVRHSRSGRPAHRCRWTPPRAPMAGVTPDFKVKPNAHSMCAQESSLHTYHTENGYKIINDSIYSI
jgi:hypothetical protein